MSEFQLNFGALLGLHGSITAFRGRTNLDLQIEIQTPNLLE